MSPVAHVSAHGGRLAAVLLAGVTALATPARAVELVLRAAPGVAGPLSAPQTGSFTVGGGFEIEGGLGVVRFLDVQVVGGFLGFAANDGAAATVAHVGAGVRFLRPRAARGLTPWLDANALYVRTGQNDRFGFN